MSTSTRDSKAVFLNTEAVPAVSRSSVSRSLVLTKVRHSIHACCQWTESPFSYAQGRRVADAWLQRGKGMRRFLRFVNHDTVKPLIMLIPCIAPAVFVFLVTGAFSNLNIEYGTWKYIYGAIPFTIVSVFGAVVMASIISKFAHTLHKQSVCPLHREFCPNGQVALSEFPGETVLRTAYADDPERMCVLDGVVQAFKQELPNGFFKMIMRPHDQAERVMEQVRAELGEEDARGLLLLLAFPDDPDTLRGGEADELLARVSEVLNDTSSPSLALP